MLEKFHGMIGLLYSLDIPTVALVDGMALGGGCELAVVCDMVLASDRAVFGQPEIKVGVFPPVAAALFPLLVGRNRALELLLSGESIDAPEAQRIGLINKVLPAASFGEKTGEFIRPAHLPERLYPEVDQASRESRPRSKPPRGYCGC